jgi:hypothetical protein
MRMSPKVPSSAAAPDARAQIEKLNPALKFLKPAT